MDNLKNHFKINDKEWLILALSFIMEIIEFIFNKGFSKEIKLKKRLTNCSKEGL